MADLSGLNLRKPAAVDWDAYPPGGGVFKRPHVPGEYTFRAPALKDIKFASQDGHLQFVNTATIVDGDENLDARVFDYVSNRPYKTGKRQGASRMGDYLMAVGSEATPGPDHEEWAAAVEETAEGLFRALTDWTAYDSDLDKEVAKTYDDFPEDPSNPGSRLPYVVIDRATGARVPPSEEGENTKRVPARQKIRFYVFGEGR